MEYAKRTARISSSTLFWALAALLGSAAVNLPTAHGQAITRVGDRVRITAPDMGLTEAVGILREVDGQNLLVEFNGTRPQVHLAADEVEKLEVSFGQKSRTRRGAVIGLLVGAGIGAVAGNTRGRSDSCVGDPNAGSQLPFPTGFCVKITRGFKRGAGAVIGGALGAMFGGAVGKSVKTERWQPAYMGDAKVSAQPVVGPKSLGLTVGIAF